MRGTTMNNIPPFAWMFCMEEEHHTEIFNELVRSRVSNMTEEDCRKYPYSGDIEQGIKLIKDLRKELKKEESNATEEYLKNAYPFELLFQFRY
jgi:hypothetical protein